MLRERIIDTLRTLPDDQVVEWHDPLVFEDGVFHGFVDVWVPQVCDPLKIAWSWTIVASEEDALSSRDVAVAPDTNIEGAPAWYPDTISRALAAWTAEHGGRPDLRFRLNSSLVSPMQLTLEEGLADTESEPFESAFGPIDEDDLEQG